MNHFDEMTVLLYLERQLDDGPRARSESARRFVRRVPCAPRCARNRRRLAPRNRSQREDESVPARLTAAPERGSAPWGWLTALGLGAGGAYTVWSGFVEPWQAQAAQAGFTQGNLLTMLFFSGAFWKGWDAMRSLMEFLAMATLGLVVIWLLRRHFRRVTTFAVVMAAMFCVLAAPPRAAAGEIAARQIPTTHCPPGKKSKMISSSLPIAPSSMAMWTAI